MLFSKRKGYSSVKGVIQKNNINEELRNGLWNCFIVLHSRLIKKSRELYATFIFSLWDNYFKKSIDTISPTYETLDMYAYDALRKYFFECNWYEVYDFIEFILNNENKIIPDFLLNEFANRCNEILERENSAYRVVDNKYILDIVSKEEINSINTTLNLSMKYKSAKTHIKAAIKLLTNKREKDTDNFRNSIKESISAVEAICREISGKDKATLGDALNTIGKNKIIHPSLNEAFKKLYGYTNDGDGIRHALLEEPNLSYEDALYMLVTCSAFINYLIEKTNLNEQISYFK